MSDTEAEEQPQLDTQTRAPEKKGVDDHLVAKMEMTDELTPA